MRRKGFTLIEIALVLIIVGVLLGVGYVSWVSLMKARKIAYTRSILYQTKNCLLKRITYSNKYPTYKSSDCSSPDNSKDIDACVCGQRDAWGRQVLYLQGRDDSGQPLSNSTGFVIKNVPANQRAEVIVSSSVVDEKNKTISHVAFVLLSKGEDGLLDNPSYANLFIGNNVVGTIPNTPSNTNFSNKKDDIVVIVSDYELKSMLKTLNY